MMDSEKFEREILKLAFETDVRITVATVAYYFGIPSRDARVKLDELIDAGLLELDSDRDGNLFYKLHQDAGSAEAGRIEALLAAPSHDHEQNRPPQESSTRRPSISETLNYSPTPKAASATASPNEGPASRPVSSDGTASYGDYGTPERDRGYSAPNYDYDRGAKQGRRLEQPSAGTWEPPQNQRFTSTRRRTYRPDATATRCGTSTFVVSENAACDGRPAQYSEPYTATCNDQLAPNPTAPYQPPLSPQEAYMREQQREASLPAVCHVGGEEDQIHSERLHLPAAAVLLSLCLPGAGQFYNGQIEKGVFMMLMTFLSWMAFFGWAFQLWSIFDALIVASRIRSAQEYERQQQQLEYQAQHDQHRAIRGRF